MSNNLQLYHMLKRKLNQWLPQERKTRVRNMALLLMGLYQGGSPHLGKIVRQWPLRGKLPSLTNRLWRFLSNPQVRVADWYRPVAETILAHLSTGRLLLVVDTTQVGRQHRMMSIGVAYRKRTLPLAWSVHQGCKGHLSVKEIRALFQRVVGVLPKGREIWVLGDTEFGSIHLLKWYRRRGWHFVLRQRSMTKVSNLELPWTQIQDLPLQPGESRTVGWVRLTEKFDQGWYWLVLHWEKGEEEPWYLVSNQSGTAFLLRLYRRRMWVEELYGDLKGHGFDLEATQLKNADRIARLVLAFCILFVWLICQGAAIVKQGLRHLLDHKSRRDKSYFRLGWDWVERCLCLQRPFRLRFHPVP